ncbi:MAG: 30S ribosomal protein S6e [archaeon]
MAEFKLNINDPKTGKTSKRDVKDDDAKVFLNKKIGDKVSGDQCGLAGYEFEIMGGSDYCGFPMRRDVVGTARKRILIVKGVGIRQKRAGRRVRKTVAGNTVFAKTSQINLKILKYGKEKLGEEAKPEAAEGKAEEKAPEKKEAKAEKKEEKPTEGKKEDPKKEEKPAEKPKEAPKAEKPADKK